MMAQAGETSQAPVTPGQAAIQEKPLAIQWGCHTCGQPTYVTNVAAPPSHKLDWFSGSAM
eukprot:c16818_g2_i1 orf=459-638(-)